MEERTLLKDMDTVFERITILELAIADLYEQLDSIQQKEEPTND